jgi:tetratricopeptide (TPR) repeat protein
MKKLFAGAFALIFAACSTGGKRLTIESEPGGAAIRTAEGELLGETPKTFEGAELEKIQKQDSAIFILKKDGYVPREVQVRIEGDDKYATKLNRLDDEFFKQVWVNEFPKETNSLARELLSIHGLILTGKLDEATRRIEEFQKSYPNLAASWVLRSNIATLQNQKEEARNFLLRAKSLDPADPVVGRLLIEEKGSP